MVENPAEKFELRSPGPTPTPVIRRTLRQRREERRKAKEDKVHYEPIVATAEELIFRHSHWAEKRARVRWILYKTGAGRNAMDSFDNCGGGSYVWYSNSEKRYLIKGSCCHNRHCAPCMRTKANLMASNLRERLNERKDHEYRLITLTLKHTNSSLADQIKRLYSSFKKLRAVKVWRKSQRGGCVMLEVKYNDKDRTWHPHLHIIAQGSFLHQTQLSEAWYAATGDSKIVDVRILKRSNDAAHYVSKYVCKGTNDEVWRDDDAAQEWVTATKGVRMCGTYGSWRGFKLLAKPESPTDLVLLGSLGGIMKEAAAGHEYFRRLLDVLVKDLQYNPHKLRPKKPPD